jgi:hypothetical protein
VATGNDLEKWLEPGLAIVFAFPTDEHPKYRATIEEFDLSAEGNTPDEAYEAVLDRVVRMLEARHRQGEPLPDRTKWLQRYTPGGGDG